MPRARSCWVPVQWGGQSLGKTSMSVPNREPAFPEVCWKLRLPSRGTLASWRPGLVGTWGDTERCQGKELGKEPAEQYSSLASSSRSPAGGPGQAGHTQICGGQRELHSAVCPGGSRTGLNWGTCRAPLHSCTQTKVSSLGLLVWERDWLTGTSLGKAKRWSRNEHIIFRKWGGCVEPRQGCSNSGHCSQVPNSGSQGREIDVSQRSTMRGWEKAARSCRKEYSNCTYGKRFWSNNG